MTDAVDAPEPATSPATPSAPARKQSPAHPVKQHGGRNDLREGRVYKKRTTNERSKTRPVNAGDELLAGQMRGTGVAISRIAQTLGTSETTVQRILDKPHIQEFVKQVREATKPIVLANIHQASIAAGEALQDVLVDKDYKAFDMLTRGIYSMEKTAASAAGENKPVPANVQVAVVNQQAESDEAKQLLRALMGGKVIEAQ